MLSVTSRADRVWLQALNARRTGVSLLAEQLKPCAFIAEASQTATRLDVRIKASDDYFTEEERSRQPSVFSVLRQLRACF